MPEVDSAIVYEDQASRFESRAGLPQHVAVQVAAAVRAHAAPDGLVVEVGAGTGVIGRWLAGSGGRYLGMDRSQAMLGVFRPRLPAGEGAVLLHADAGLVWPVEDRSASVVFGSRVLHLLPPEHTLEQVHRVAHPLGAVLLCGRIEHSGGSPRVVTRRRLRELLAARGLRTRPTGGRPERLLAAALARGAEPLDPRAVATWPEAVSVAQVIDWWRGMTSIGGITPPVEVAREVLAELTDWAGETFPDPAAPIVTDTRYLLEGVRLAPVQ